MEPAQVTKMPLVLSSSTPVPPFAFPGARRFASISLSLPFFFGGGGGGGRRKLLGGGGGGDGGEEAAAGAAAEAAAAALGETAGADPDAILLHVGGMSCGGCAASVKRILENQPEVISATVDFEKAVAIVRTTPEVKVTQDWQKQLGEKLANHLTTCGFESHLQEEAAKEN